MLEVRQPRAHGHGEKGAARFAEIAVGAVAVFLQEDGRHVEHAGNVFNGEPARRQPFGILIAHAKLLVVHATFKDRRFPGISGTFVALQCVQSLFALHAVEPLSSSDHASRHHAIFHNAGTVALLGQT